jgi:hypothetical protein
MFTLINRPQLVRGILTLGAALAVAAVAEAGPPLICHPFDAGSAKLLPWTSQGQNWNTPDRSYDVQKLTADTLRLLSPDAPIIARMENMRRATIYAGQDRRVAADLMNAVLARATADAARGGKDSLAAFDAGYLIESYSQASHIQEWSFLSETANVAVKAANVTGDGYGLVRHALDVAAAPNPEMEYAASLMKNGAISAEHRRKAEAGAKAGSLLARNLEK